MLVYAGPAQTGGMNAERRVAIARTCGGDCRRRSDGMMLAGELALAGVDVAIVERRPNQDLAGTRAGGLHARTIEVLDQRGIADRFISQGQVHRSAGFGMIPLDISDFPTRHNYLLALTQNHIERILAEWVGELAVTIYRERVVTGFTQDDTGVDVALSDGQSLRAEYLVGCDGGRSVIRKSAGIEFPGWDATTSWLIAEVEWAEEPAWGFREDAAGTHALGKMENARAVRVVLTERQVGSAGEPTLRDVSEALIAIYGTDYGIHSPTWISRFTDMTRQAARLPRPARPARRRRRARASPDGWTGPQHRRAGFGEPGMEAGAGGQTDVAGQPPRYLPRRAPPRRGARAAQHDGAGRASPLGRPRQGPGRHRFRAPQPGRGSPARRRGDLGSRRSLRPRRRDIRCSDAACPISTWSPPTARCGSSPCCTTPGRCSSTSVSPAASTSRHGPIAFS